MSTSSAPVLAPPAGTYRIDPQRSTVAYSGRHMFGAGAVHASFTVQAGTCTVEDPVTGSTVALVVDAASFRSDSARRDRDVASAAFLDAASHPQITFSSTGVRDTGTGLVVEGHLTAHGTTVPVEVEVTSIDVEADGMRVRARATHLDRYAFGITGSKGLAGRYFDVDFDIVATRA